MALAVATAAAGATLWGRLSSGIAGRIGAAMVIVSGAAMVVVGFAQQDCSELVGACAAAEQAGTLTGHHIVHQLVSLAVFTVLTVALFPLARGLKRSGSWAHLAVPTRLAAAVLLALIPAIRVGVFGDSGGLAQRAFIAVLFGWPALLAAVPARRRPPPPARQPGPAGHLVRPGRHHPRPPGLRRLHVPRRVGGVPPVRDG